MKIVQLGVCVGNDDLTELIGNKQPEILVLVEPMSIHNDSINSCYRWVNNKIIENIAITTDDKDEISFFYHQNDGPKYEVASNDVNHILKHGYNSEGIVELKVKTISINDLLKKYNLEHLDVLFIDTEGIDDVIIKSIDFNKFKIDQIYFENLHLTQHDIYEFLEKKGYEITKNWGYRGWTSVAKKKKEKQIQNDMKKFNLRVLTYTGQYGVTVEAKTFITQTNSSTSSGFYSFYNDSSLIACYPIDKTIIESIETI